MKVHIPPTKEDPTQFSTIKKHFQQFVKDVNRIYKPSNWKWVVVFELQKQTGNWHWHLFSTPFVPYTHQCQTIKKGKAKSCWDCRVYVNKLWTHGRVQSLSLTKRTTGSYLAKYIAKSFKLRSLYRDHGFKEKDRIYHFFSNLYEYEQKPITFVGKYRLDAQTGQKLNNNQHIFRRYNYDTEQTSYFYRTNRKLIGKRAHPEIVKKHYKIGTRSSNPLPLLDLTQKSKQKLLFLFKKPEQILTQDFRQLYFTHFLFYCKSAWVSKIPIQKRHIPKEAGKCVGDIYQHLETKLVFRFTFPPENIPLVLDFLSKLDTYAEEYGMEESKDFFDPRFTDPIESRNAYLNNWQWAISDYQPHCKQPLFEGGRTAM